MGIIPVMQDGSMSAKQSDITHCTIHKHYMIISTDAKKTFDKIQHPFMIKTHNKVGIKGMYLNITKTIYAKPS